MNNNSNRNNNNRRRGRGNRNQGGGGGGGGNNANRIDSRARGNAPQLLDKYKKLAQDAQHNGDRVQMEYYLQFADHYFRVIADNKARQDEQRVKRDGAERGYDRDDEDEDDEGENARRSRQGGNRDTRSSRRSDNDDRSDGQDDDAPADDNDGDIGVFDRDNSEEARAERQRNRRARKPRGPDTRVREGASGVEGEIDASVLPPSIAAIESDAAPAKPRRRRRPVDDEGDSETLSAVG